MLARDGSEIVALEARLYSCLLPEPVGYAQGFLHARESAVARIVTADGTVGWGEAYGPAARVHTAIAGLGRVALGVSVFERRSLTRGEDAEGKLAEDPVMAAAWSAVQLAAADAAAKLLGCPLRALFGGMRSPPLRVYASALWFRQQADPTAHYGEALREAEAMGFTAVKAKIGWGTEADLCAIDRMRQASSSMTLMVDANQAYGKLAAATVADAAADAGVLWFEEPLPPDQLHAYAELRAIARLAIAGGETIVSPPQARRWLEVGAVDVLQPDVCLAGGLEAVSAISDLLTGKPVIAPHCFGLGLGLAASLHWAAVIGASAGSEPIWLEVDTAPNPAREALLDGCAWFGDGGLRLEVPSEPGLGVDLDRIEQYRVI